MKRIFCLFFIFLGVFWGVLPCQATKVDGQDSFVTGSVPSDVQDKLPSHLQKDSETIVFEKIAQWGDYFQQNVKQASQLKPKDISLIEHPQNMNFYTLFALSGMDAGLLTGEKGLGQKQTYDFGEARLLSCVGNLNQSNTLITGFLVRLKQGWSLQKPILPLTPSSLWTSEEIYYPLRTENNTNRTDKYENLVIFPMVYRLTDANKDFVVKKDITLTACQNDICQTQSRPFQLTVQAGKGYQTDVCAAIMSEMYASPSFLPSDIQVGVHQNKELIQLQLLFPENVTSVDVQIDYPVSFVIQKKYIQGKRAHLILKTDKPIPNGEKITFYILTSLGRFVFKAIPDNQPFVIDEPSISLWHFVFYGFWVFLFSPLYLMFWSLRPQNHEQLKQAYYFALLTVIGFVVLWSSLIYFDVAVHRLFYSKWVIFAQTILVLFLLIKPFIKPLWILILMFCVPYPFLYTASMQLPPKEISSVLIVFWWGICLIFPFVMTHKHLILFQSMALAMKPIHKIIRLPFLLMFVWMSFSLVLSFMTPNNTFDEKLLQNALKKGEGVYVSVYTSPCPICVVNEYALTHFYPTDTYVKQQKLRIMTLNQNSVEGKDFLKKYRIQSGVSFGLLFGPKQTYGLRIENAYIHPQEWINYFDEVGLLPQEKAIFTEEILQEDVQIDENKLKEMIYRFEH